MTVPDVRPTGRPTLTAAERLTAGVGIAYVALFLVMWGPTWFGFGGWLFLYPLLLLAWLPIEALLVVCIVLLARAAIGRTAGPAGPSPWTVPFLVAASLLAAVSLPVLWFGTSFFVPVL